MKFVDREKKKMKQIKSIPKLLRILENKLNMLMKNINATQNKSVDDLFKFYIKNFVCCFAASIDIKYF